MGAGRGAAFCISWKARKPQCRPRRKRRKVPRFVIIFRLETGNVSGMIAGVFHPKNESQIRLHVHSRRGGSSLGCVQLLDWPGDSPNPIILGWPGLHRVPVITPPKASALQATPSDSSSRGGGRLQLPPAPYHSHMRDTLGSPPPIPPAIRPAAAAAGLQRKGAALSQTSQRGIASQVAHSLLPFTVHLKENKVEQEPPPPPPSPLPPPPPPPPPSPSPPPPPSPAPRASWGVRCKS